MRLTPEQEAEISTFGRKYLAAALSPKRTSREKITSAIAEIYAESGRPAPAVIILPSPAKAKEGLNSVRPGRSLWKNMFHNIQELLWKAIDGELARHIREHTLPIEAAIYEVLNPIYEQLQEQKILPMPVLFGSSGLCWMVWAKFAEEIGVGYSEAQSKRLAILERISLECEFWWPFDGVCFASERPLNISCNDKGQLHNEDGPAVRYEDGYCVFAYEGQRLTGMDWLIERRMS